MTVTLQTITKASIHEIQELWECNLSYHENIGSHFASQYQGLSFFKRMEILDDFSEEDLCITLAWSDDVKAGYCLSTFKNGVGELLTMHVHENFRGQGIGQSLVKDHLKWFNAKDCTAIGVHVDCSNANTIAFYSKLGFFPNTMYMQLTNDCPELRNQSPLSEL
jgi:ribosomal protein S18 acetylase RimI-like enzyme